MGEGGNTESSHNLTKNRHMVPLDIKYPYLPVPSEVQLKTNSEEYNQLATAIAATYKLKARINLFYLFFHRRPIQQLCVSFL